MSKLKFGQKSKNRQRKPFLADFYPLISGQAPKREDIRTF